LALHVRGGDHFYLDYPRARSGAPVTVEPVERWATMAARSPEELASIARELARSVGIDALEPLGGVSDRRNESAAREGRRER
jgi:hypothetical protein